MIPSASLPWCVRSLERDSSGRIVLDRWCKLRSQPKHGAPRYRDSARGMLLLSVTDDEGPDGEVVWACIYVTATQLEEMARIARSWDPK